MAKACDYSSSKFAAFGFDESLRLELKHLHSKVKTTCICPYYINTGMFKGAKARLPILLEMLDEKWVSERTVQAIRQEEPVIVMPFFCNASFLMRALIPVGAFDFVGKVIGVSSSMDHFIGRK
jgi:all-trans-retinol dehydrogenase (NAD+)